MLLPLSQGFHNSINLFKKFPQVTFSVTQNSLPPPELNHWAHELPPLLHLPWLHSPSLPSPPGSILNILSLNWWGSFKPGVKTHRLEADLRILLATEVDARPLHQVILSDNTSVWHMAGTEQLNTEMTVGKVFNLESWLNRKCYFTGQLWSWTIYLP